ncbi:hypothetical protein EPN83_02320 [Patescibacteria group bacterium]|nr:MAG: hypothetical protein EPN83_02320 [Patescibacteria group bacterium]
MDSKKETIKISFLAFRPPSEFARARKTDFILSPYSAPSARPDFALTSDQVSICDLICGKLYSFPWKLNSSSEGKMPHRGRRSVPARRFFVEAHDNNTEQYFAGRIWEPTSYYSGMFCADGTTRNLYECDERLLTHAVLSREQLDLKFTVFVSEHGNQPRRCSDELLFRVVKTVAQLG